VVVAVTKEPIKKEKAPARVREPGRPLLATLASVFIEILVPVVRTLVLIVQFAAFVFFLVITYYVERVKGIFRFFVRTYRMLISLRLEDIQDYFRSTVTEARKEIAKAGTTIQELFPVNRIELLNFTRHLAVLLHAGVPLARSLEILYKQCENKRFADAVGRVYRAVISEGYPLSKAMALCPRIFSSLYVNMMSAGEVSGKLDTVLDRIGQFLESDLKLRQKVKAASTYPIVIAVVSFLFFSFFVYIILPKFMMIFDGLNVPLPLPTRILIAFVNFAHSPITILITFVIATIVFFPLFAFLRSVLGKERVDLLKLKLPVFGKIYKKILLARFCSTFGSLIDCGVPLLEALDVTGKASGNEFFYGMILEMSEEVRVGLTLNSIIEKILFFPSILLSMVKVGEESGTLHQMLLRLSDIYENEVTLALQQFVALIEPILMAVMGVVVGFVILAVFLPVYSILQGIH